MAVTNIVNGFVPVRDMHGVAYNGAANTYYKDANVANTIIALGDPVIRVTGSTDPNGGPSIVRATTGGAITGVVVGVYVKVQNLHQANYMLAGDTGYIFVADDPNLWLEVTESGVGTALAITNIGNHINSCAAINGNIILGMSNYTIDNNAVSAANTFRIEMLAPDIGNTASGVGTRWIVSPSLHTEVNASATNLTNV